MCDRVGVMARGRLVAEGPPGTLRGDGRPAPCRGRRPRAGAAQSVPHDRRGPSPPSSLRAASGSRCRAAPRRPTSTLRSCAPGCACTRWCPSATRSRTCSSPRGGRRCTALSSRRRVRRWRTWLLAAALGAIPVVMTIALKLSPPPAGASEDGPPFLRPDPGERALRPADRPGRPAAVLPAARDRAVQRRRDRGGGAGRHAPVPPAAPGARGHGCVLAKYAVDHDADRVARRRGDPLRDRPPARSSSVWARCRRCRGPRSRSGRRCCGSSRPASTW